MAAGRALPGSPNLGDCGRGSKLKYRARNYTRIHLFDPQSGLSWPLVGYHWLAGAALSTEPKFRPISAVGGTKGVPTAIAAV
jgi:hypothetical protein